jgi:gamma-glutamyltranspeptidase/glutathione hydrolase
LARSLEPAIRLARGGVAVDERYRRLAELRRAALSASLAAAEQFLSAGDVPPEGWVLAQPDLAATLERLATHGRDGFYRGATARRLVAGVAAAGGIWSAADLEAYRVVERAPVRGEYRGLRLVSASPPSSGGVVLVQMLNMLAGYDLARLDAADRTHLLVEVMRRAYRDRAEFLGDPDFVDMPLERLLDPDYAAGLVRDLDPSRATPSRASAVDCAAGSDTTHFSLLDREGNRVAATLSINYPFGAGFVPPGTGVLLNNEMDDFSVRTGVPNLYGLVGGEANAVAAGKRMLSSMTPTFVESGDGVAILGTPGGSRIITMLLHAVLGVADGAEPAEWVASPRFHHQYLPDRVQYEPGALSPGVAASLRSRGHRLEALERPYGDMQAVFWDRAQGRVLAASDPRGGGLAAVRTGTDIETAGVRPHIPGDTEGAARAATHIAPAETAPTTSRTP